MFSLAVGTLASKSGVVLEGLGGFMSSSETFFGSTDLFVFSFTMLGDGGGTGGEFKVGSEVLKFLGEDGQVFLGKDGTFFGWGLRFLVLGGLTLGKVRVEEGIANVGCFKGLNDSRLGFVMLRGREVGASIDRVQSGVLVGCFETSRFLVHSSHGGGIIILTSTVASRKWVAVLCRRTLRVLCRRTGDSCLHGSLPVPHGKAVDGSEELVSSRGWADIQRFDVSGATMLGCHVQHELRHSGGDGRTCAMARRVQRWFSAVRALILVRTK
jgi:hypothetical protein